MMPDAKELTRIRADMQAATLPDVCNVLTLTQVSDGMGGFTETWGTATANVFCRMDNVIANQGVGIEMVSAGALKSYSQWILSAPFGTGITSANRIEHGTYIYNVVEVNDEGSWLGNMRVTLERL